VTPSGMHVPGLKKKRVRSFIRTFEAIRPENKLSNGISIRSSKLTHNRNGNSLKMNPLLLVSSRKTFFSIGKTPEHYKIDDFLNFIQNNRSLTSGIRCPSPKMIVDHPEF